MREGATALQVLLATEVE